MTSCRCLLTVLLLGAAGAMGAAPGAKEFILQSSDVDPTAPTSQPAHRWYHWIGADPAVTHLETAIAVDSDRYAGRGQRIEVQRPAPLSALQVKIKRIGRPGPLQWQVGTTRGADDLGRGQVAPEQFSVQYEHFVTLPLSGAPPPDKKGTVPICAKHPSGRPGKWGLSPFCPPTVYLSLRAAAGRCPEDYYAVYCTWRENDPRTANVNCYTGMEQVGMMYRNLRADPHGAALEADGTPVVQGASMMTRLLTEEPGPGRRRIVAGEEEPYQFVERLAAGIDPRRAGLPWPEVRPEPGEVAIDPGWRIVVAATKSPSVGTAVQDLAGFLKQSMGVALPVTWEASARPAPRTITLTQGKDLPDGPRKPAGYRFVAGADGIRIHGYDAPGVLRGVWHLEELLMLRGAALVNPDARTREPRFWPRATCATWAGTGELCCPAPVYTDGQLSLMSHYGYDAIWLNWYPGPERGARLPTQIAPGQVPEGTTYQPFTPRLRELVDRAERYGMEVVILYASPYPADDRQREIVRQEARQFLRDVPKIRTIIMLDEGMGSRAGGLEAWVATCSLLARAFTEVRPDVRLVAWRYSFGTHTPDAALWDRAMEKINTLDPRLGYMANFDSFWSRRRDGALQHAYDYCLSLKAPSEDYRHAIEWFAKDAAEKHHAIRPVWTKIETRFSQEANTQPEIPCMQRWAERYQALVEFRPPIEGLIANWYHQGFYPTPVTELFGWLAYTNPPPVDDLLRAMARRDFGPGQEQLAVDAWKDFSEAIWHFPFYYGLSFPMNAGLAQPFWLDSKAANPRPWRRGFVNSLAGLTLAEKPPTPAKGSSKGARFAEYNGSENRARLGEFDALWHAGLTKLRKAVEAAPRQVRTRADDNWRTARSIGDKSAMTLRLVRWLDARARWEKASTAADAWAALADLERVGREELAACRAALPLYLCDSRMGHLNHGRGCFTATSILDKIAALQQTLDQQIPAARERVKQ